MRAILILSLALFSGAASAFQLQNRQSLLAIHRYPTIVQVQFYTPVGSLDWMQACSASILNELYVLSAASCFTGPNYPGIKHSRIRAGTNYSSMGGGQVVYLSTVINYVDRNASAQFVPDIAVVRLNSRLVFNDLVRQAPLLRQGSVVPIGITLSQVGWGRGYAVPLTVGKITTYRSSLNLPSNIITALHNFGDDNVWRNGDIGSPWIWGNVTVGIRPQFDMVANMTGYVRSATSVASYTDWIISVAR